MNKYRVIAICGESAAGKDTYLQEMLKVGYGEVHEIISCTTRPPRQNELDGRNYHFLTSKQYADKIKRGEMLETSHFRDWFYGTSIDALQHNKINIGVFNPTGIRSLLKDPRVSVYVVRMIAPAKMRLLRSLNREDNPDVDEIVRRYLADEEDFKDFFLENERIFNVGEEGMRDMAIATLAEARSFWAD